MIKNFSNLKKVAIRQRSPRIKKVNEDGIVGVIVLVDETLMIRIPTTDNIHPIVIKDDDLDVVDYVYSNPFTNKYHEPWMRKHSPGTHTRNDISIKFWSIVKPKMRVRGTIEEDGFHINYKHLNEITDKIVQRCNNKLTK